jgi:hypothetical protein
VIINVTDTVDVVVTTHAITISCVAVIINATDIPATATPNVMDTSSVAVTIHAMDTHSVSVTIRVIA